MHGVRRRQKFPQSNERRDDSPCCAEEGSAARWPQADRPDPGRIFDRQEVIDGAVGSPLEHALPHRPIDDDPLISRAMAAGVPLTGLSP